MRFSLLASTLAAAVLAGCSSTPSGSLTASSGSAASSGGGMTSSAPAGQGDRMCNADPVMNIVGKPLNDRAANDAQQRAGAATLRVMRPGQVMTMEYNPRRLTVVMDEKSVVSSVRCG
ncbi:hypothetical protein IMZ29_17605 [Achromobacter sp. GG226]|uniref:I78 family peptidase inhibitor n=1 Tax=Verticiella alkaliphila TaxID=2779529 RepID=UPI001C0B018D|nr:I78 family peptidase inhibitor [Verticiella sp. GG226]MBU4612292.1 hypothetical protein [Verticiella sp. GG226]